MNNFKLIVFIAFLLNTLFAIGQTKDELLKLKAEKQSEANKFQKQADSIQNIIDNTPGWRIGAFGTIGGSISGFRNWYAQGTPNNNSGNVGFTINAFANKIGGSYFWRNSLNLNLNWAKLDDRDNPDDSDNFEPTTDVFNLTSIYGHKLSKAWAISSLLEYRTTLLDNFNDPGYLDVGIGISWTPIPKLIVVIQPANYNFIFSNNDAVFENSIGAKIVADYTKQIGKINLKTNLSTFQSYEDSNLSNWTWINTFSYSFWKGIGLGIDFGLRSNRQEAANFQNVSIEDADNKIQSYYTAGLSYKF